MISKEVFGLSTQADQAVMRRMGSVNSMFIMECRTCGFEPEDQDVLPAAQCPRCFATTWRRLPRPGALANVVQW